MGITLPVAMMMMMMMMVKKTVWDGPQQCRKEGTNVAAAASTRDSLDGGGTFLFLSDWTGPDLSGPVHQGVCKVRGVCDVRDCSKSGWLEVGRVHCKRIGFARTVTSRGRGFHRQDCERRTSSRLGHDYNY